MKKILIKLIIFIVFITINNHIFATNLDTKQKILVENLSNSIQKERQNYDYNYKIQKYKSMISLLEMLETKIQSDRKELAIYLKILLQNQLNSIISLNINTENSYTIPNVDIQKVKTERLKRHNEARQNVGKPPYSRDNKLEKTAYNRASYLANINKSTHKRKSTDGYYNYDSIKERFANQGIYFDESKGTAFTENIAYQYYSCNKSDCTQDLINAIKKGFNFFMSEASYNGAHYRGIVHPNFTKIGMGIAFVGKRYYIVTHYAVGIK